MKMIITSSNHTKRSNAINEHSITQTASRSSGRDVRVTFSEKRRASMSVNNESQQNGSSDNTKNAGLVQKSENPQKRISKDNIKIFKKPLSLMKEKGEHAHQKTSTVLSTSCCSDFKKSTTVPPSAPLQLHNNRGNECTSSSIKDNTSSLKQEPQRKSKTNECNTTKTINITTCIHCKKNVSLNSSLSRHIAKAHPNLRKEQGSMQCDLCNERCTPFVHVCY